MCANYISYNSFQALLSPFFTQLITAYYYYLRVFVTKCILIYNVYDLKQV